jgi:hypothetical protein
LKELTTYSNDGNNVFSAIERSADTKKRVSVAQTLGRFAQQDGRVIWRIVRPYALMVGAAVIIATIGLMTINGVFLVLMCFVSIFAAFGVFFLGAQAWQRKISALMDFPHVYATDNHLKIGQAFTVKYQHRFKQETTIEELKIQLVKREWVEYTQGTSTYTDTRDIVIEEHWRDMVPVREGQTVTLEFDFDIPLNSMHTWTRANNNRITWMLKLTVDLPGWLDYAEDFGLNVLPEVERV